MKNVFIEPGRNEWQELTRRPLLDDAALENMVWPVLEEVKLYGDDAVRKYNKKFGQQDPGSLKVSEQEIQEAAFQVEDGLKNAIGIAKNNITRFHQAQTELITKITTTPGVVCWRRSVAIRNVGLYIPGGSAPLFSTLLMLAIPAQVAGCSNIVVCTPADSNGNVHPAILYTAGLLGIKNICKTGGAQAIGAMAYGTESIPKTDKIFGPGNQYVTCAKQLINKEGIAIDMPAGPSEVAVFADDSAEPAFIAADLLSQAEHGTDSQVVLVATSIRIIRAVQQEIDRQLQQLPRKKIAETALQQSRFIVLQDVENAFDFLNEYAPEHLVIASGDAEALSGRVINAGSVFLGNYSPEAVGDYASGTNHTLPTNGYAKSYSGVSVDSFVKKITFQQLSQEGLKNIGPAVECMAAAEGLEGHKRAISIRMERL